MRKRAVLAVAIALFVLGITSQGLAGEPSQSSRAPSTQLGGEDSPGSIEDLFAIPLLHSGRRESPDVFNTPAPPADSSVHVLQASGARLPDQDETARTSPASPREVDVLTGPKIPEEARKRVEALREVGLNVRVYSPVTRPAAGMAPQATSEEVCIYALRNPQMDVVELGDGTASLEYWTAPYHKVYYSKVEYNSELYSLLVKDETDGSDTVLDPFWGSGMDYDLLAQGFQAPANVTYLKVAYSNAVANANDSDDSWSNIWGLTASGALSDTIAYAPIVDGSSGWGNWYWELTQAEDAESLARISGRRVALVFDSLSDQTAPGEILWVDDAQVTLCYQRGAASVYLPLAAKRYGESSGPNCVPREPDSVNQMGKTAVGATCTGSLGSVDEKDYYALTLNGASALKLRLFDMPDGTNWDGHIFEDDPGAGYPLVCYTGSNSDPFDDPKSVNCNVNPSKDYFVMMNRGPETISGQYKVSVTRR